ncbi:MAG: hypothetical protein QXG10_05250 [Candidatus Hadarchaeales archaeon]
MPAEKFSSGTTKKLGAVIAVVALLAITVFVFYFSTRPSPETVPPPENVPEENEGKPGYVEMPTQEIISALATSEGVSAENVELQFCALAVETDKDHFAAGAIVSNRKSIVLIFENSTGRITVENEYTASTQDELLAISITKREISKWTGNKIVAGWFQSAAGGYTFKYYDGYSTRFQRWLFGFGTVNVENSSIVWGVHSV